MIASGVSLQTVDLDTCASEPIHTPGSVQPHGTLLALDLQGSLTHASRNVATLIPRLSSFGDRPTNEQLWSILPLREVAEGMLEDAAVNSDVPPLAIQASIDGEEHDVVLHARAGHVVIEFERRTASNVELASFAILAHRSLSRLKTCSTIESILNEAIRAVKEVTGFDRVMAYRFHADNSGEVVAEARHDKLDPYLGRRFPATDIPAQARRLYLLNTLRLIADVHDEQVPIDAFVADKTPLDLSYSILRSVSPIHIEYLKNIDVSASMSLSIVVENSLWGLIACHHRSALRVPYAVRMACDVLAQGVASAIQMMLLKRISERREAAIELRARLISNALQGESLERPTGLSNALVDRVIASDQIVFVQGNDIQHEGMPAEAATELLRWLDTQTDDLIARDELSALPPALQSSLHPFAGLLALRLDRTARGWLMLLRLEQSANVTWSGPPDKVARVGPLGARLTPAGSLAEWQQSVRGSAPRWDELDLELARLVLDDVLRASARQAAEMVQARSHLLAILGHDLRDPLQAISMAASLIERGRDQVLYARRITMASGRMARLIGQVLDMSRIQGGLGIALNFVVTDLTALVRQLVDEAQLAYPSSAVELTLPERLDASVDPDRLTQAVSNLLANARQHGRLGESIGVSLTTIDGRAVLTIDNVAEPIGDDVIDGLFDPLKRGLRAAERNPSGLGLGLYIACQVMKGHSGSIAYTYAESRVRFTIELPRYQRGNSGRAVAVIRD